MSKTVSIFIAVVTHCIVGIFLKDSLDFTQTCILGVIGLHLCRFTKEEGKCHKPIWWLLRLLDSCPVSCGNQSFGHDNNRRSSSDVAVINSSSGVRS